jgi:rubredoxin-NAD+ reductase
MPPESDAGIVVVGCGHAALSLVRELRRRDARRAVTIVTADSGDVYSKPALSTAHADQRPLQALVSQNAAAMAEALDVRLLAHTRALSIDVPSRMLHTDRGVLRYEVLVLATGASPRPLRVSGDGGADAIAVNSLDDYRRLRARLGLDARVAVIGAGLVGCELALDLRTGGHAVALFDSASRPLHRLLPDFASQRIAAALARAGVALHLGQAPDRVMRGPGGYRVGAGAIEEEVDVVVSAIGLHVEAGLPGSADIATAAGIVTDDCLRTSAPHVFALGDCVQIDGRLQPFLLPIMHGARALAATLCGTPTAVRYPPMPVTVKTPACPTLMCAPAPAEAGRWVVEADDSDGLRGVFLADASHDVLGFVLQGGRIRERAAMLTRLTLRSPVAA